MKKMLFDWSTTAVVARGTARYRRMKILGAMMGEAGSPEDSRAFKILRNYTRLLGKRGSPRGSDTEAPIPFSFDLQVPGQWAGHA